MSQWPLIAARTMLLVALATVAALIWAVAPLPSLSTDSLIYHLSIPAWWIRAGLWAPLDLPFHDAAAEHSPMLAQTLSYLLMRLTGDDSLCFILGPLCLLAMLWVFHSSVRLLGAPRPVALAMTAVAATFKPFLDSVQTVNNDLLLTLGAAVVLHGMLVGKRWPRAGLIWAACGIATMLLSKTVAVIYAGVGVLLLAPLLAQASRLHRCRQDACTTEGRQPLATRGYWLVAVAAGIIAIGGAFFIRNWICHGNPLYPAEIRIGGWTVFGGVYNTSAVVDHGWSPSALRQMFIGNDAFFAPSLSAGILMAASFIAAFVLAIASPRGRRFAKVTIAFPLLAAVAFFLLVPFWRQHRLLFPVYYALLLTAASVSGILCRANHRIVTPIVVLVLAALVMLRLGRMGVLLDNWLVISLAVAVVLSLLRWPAGSVKYLARPVVIAALLLAVATSPWWQPDLARTRLQLRGAQYAKYYGRLGEAWAMLDREGRDKSLTIAYTGTPLTFPLFGWRLQNRVVYVPLSSDDRPQPVDLEPGQSVYKALAETHRIRVDEAYWLDGLRRSGVQWLLVDDDPAVGGAGQELGIIAAHPTDFEQAYACENIRLYRVKPGDPTR